MTLYERVSADADKIVEQLKAQGIDAVLDNAGVIYFSIILIDTCSYLNGVYYVNGSEVIDEEEDEFYKHLIDYKDNVVEAIWNFYSDCYESTGFNSFDAMRSIVDDFIQSKCINKTDINWRK